MATLLRFLSTPSKSPFISLPNQCPTFLHNHHDHQVFSLKIPQNNPTTTTSSLALLANPNLHPDQTGPTNLLIMDPTSLNKTPSEVLDLPFLSHGALHSDSDIIGSSYGLLCISNYPSWLSIFNPITRTHKLVFFPDNKHMDDDHHWIDFGFGYDHSSDDYKLVRLDQIGSHYDPSKKVTVFSLKTQSWKSLVKGFPHFLCHPKGHGKYADNSLFWLTTTAPPKIYNLPGLMQIMGYGDVSPYDYAIVAFDLATEKFKLFDLPEYGVNVVAKEELFLPRLSLWVLEGKDLCLMVVHGELRSRLLDVWLFKDVGENDKGGWRKIVSRFAYASASQNGLPLRPLVIRKGPGGSEELLFSQRCEFFWYDLRNGKIRDVLMMDYPLQSTFTIVSGHSYCYDPVPFVPSLISLDANNGECSEDDLDSSSKCEVEAFEIHYFEVNFTDGSSSATQEL